MQTRVQPSSCRMRNGSSSPSSAPSSPLAPLREARRQLEPIQERISLRLRLRKPLHSHIEVGERGGRRRHLLWLHCGALLLLLLLQEVLVAHAAEALRVDAAEESAAILAEAWVALLCVPLRASPVLGAHLEICPKLSYYITTT